MTQSILVGKTLNNIKIADDSKAILFQITSGDVIAKTDGDCCSSTWVENIEVTIKKFPAQVLSVEYLDLPGSLRDDENYECLQVYGCKIETDQGTIIIDYRNSSNGYYGGNLSWPDDNYFYGGVYGQNISTERWIDLP